MNKSALTEQRRETVIGLLKSMNIKKSDAGGFDREDVYECMQQLCELYEKNIEELEDSYESEINVLRERYQKYDDNNELYVSLIMEAKKSSNEIINQAKEEMETILSEGREQVAKQEKDLEQMRSGMETEKETITIELNASREAVEAEKKAMKAELEAEREKVSALKNKYKQQLNAMEEEFGDIKTNIMRTAVRIDSIKSKLSDDEDAAWSVNKDLDTVDFPTAEEGIENVFAVEDASADSVPVIEPEVDVDTVAADSVVDTAAESAEDYIETSPEAAPAADGDAGIDMAGSAETAETSNEAILSAQDDDVTTQEKPVEDDSVFTLEDLMSPEEKDVKAIDDGIGSDFSLDDIEIELPDLSQTPAEETPATEAANDDLVDEISFEGLEDLFKDEN